MLGFTPLAGAAIGGSAVVREVVPADVTGIPASVTLGVSSMTLILTVLGLHAEMNTYFTIG